ncbi:signal recognition particle-docking protein FtsY [Shewanella fidelis]|uniref:Signal recognition particle receptor FtsY n=5 Tax=Shewanella fidelis TaxID=173509 RepID=A0AAW8NUL2_9GAMM|nr:signal recognition particle-docking protein FtsY [Shewanella fidelis]MDR8525589.1 signal recognition particle-docking protein FtsY [Shewanella fidelis]
MAKKGFFSWFRRDKSKEEAEAAEAAKLAQEQQEQERLAAEQAAEQARLEAERIESERIAAEQAKAARIEAERVAAEQAEAARIEAERVAAEQAEAARIEAERIAAEQAEAARIEAERFAAEQAEAQKAAAEQAAIAEARILEEQAEAVRIEAERMAAEQAEAARIEAERIAAEQAEAARIEAERIAAEQAEAARIEAERIAAEQAEAARIEAERIAAEQAEAARIEAERIAAEQAEAARIEAERIAAEQAEAARIEAERVAAEQAEAERIEAERIAAEQAEAARIEAERIAAEQAEAARLEAERVAAEQAEAARLEAERIAVEQAEAARIEAERVAAEQAEAERIEAERIAAEQAAEQPEPQAKPVKEGLFARLKRGLKRTSESIGSGFIGLFSGKKIDDDLFEELEEQLLIADVGVETTTRLINSLTEQASRKQLKDGEALYDLLREEMQKTLDPVSAPLIPENADGPFVILMVGVNGVGKTTTIGKLAKQYQAQGKSVMLAAGDTFRAAAVEQLQVWGQRNDIPVIAQHTGADSASVLFDALQAARARNVDVLIADTAGRLQNKAHLMDELKKVVRVMKKQDETAPHEVMLTLDASTGQNAISQAQLFQEAVGVTGITISKLDGTAKGGVIFAIADKFGIPIRHIGVGEQIDDLRTFDAKDFIEALFSQTKDDKDAK